jgi:hypothetical protein
VNDSKSHLHENKLWYFPLFVVKLSQSKDAKVVIVHRFSLLL